MKSHMIGDGKRGNLDGMGVAMRKGGRFELQTSTIQEQISTRDQMTPLTLISSKIQIASHFVARWRSPFDGNNRFWWVSTSDLQFGRCSIA